MQASKTPRRAFFSAGLTLPVAGASVRMGLAGTAAATLEPSATFFKNQHSFHTARAYLHGNKERIPSIALKACSPESKVF